MLHLKIFTLQFSNSYHGFDDSVVTDFIKDKEVSSVREHFFIKDEIPFWTILVIYHARIVNSISVVPNQFQAKTQDNYRQLLSEADYPLFNTLKTWRAERAKAEGIPPYIICTNKQLAEMVTKKPTRLNQLEQIEGIGKAKLEKYGTEILGLLAIKPLEQA